MRRKGLLFAIIVCVLLSLPSFAAGRVVLVSWDGAADWIMDGLLASGEMPNVAKLAKKGVRAEYMTTSYPSVTAAAHASIWTGAYGNINGITGNRVPVLPKNAHAFTETTSGFYAEPLTAEPIWMTVARSGKSAAVVQSTQAEPTDVFADKARKDGIAQDRLFLSTGYRYFIAPPEVLTAESGWKDAQVSKNFPTHNGTVESTTFRVGDTGFSAYLFDSRSDPVNGFDSALVEKVGSSEKAVLKPKWSTSGTTDQFSHPFAVTKDGRMGYVHFRLFELSPDGRSVILYHTSVNALDSNQPAEAAALLKAAGGFYDGEFGVYRSGGLGKPVFLGGDGSAERRVLELVRLDIEKAERSTDWGMANLHWDLLINYLPMIDGAEHMWLGVLDPESHAHDPAKAKQLWPFLKQVYRLHDEFLGDVMKHAPKDAAIFLVSDHGMQGVSKWVYTNRLLEKAGLAKLNSNGTVDPASSKAAAVGSGSSVYINTTDHKGGIVPPDQKEAVLRQVESVLHSATDPETGRNVVARTFRADDAPDVGTGGPRGADLMVDFANGYDARDSGGNQDSIVEDITPIGTGVHGGFPYQVRLRAVFVAGGSGVPASGIIPPVRTIDIAPTICRMLGVRRPAQAVGSGEVISGLGR